jgi:predicted peptidase
MNRVAIFLIQRLSSSLLAWLLVAILLQLSALAQVAKPTPGQTAKTLAKATAYGGKIDYLLSLPGTYGQDTAKKWPLMLFLHGSGERGSDVWMVAKHGPPKLAAAGQDLQFIIVSPQCPEGQDWRDEPLLALLNEVCAKYSVDRERIYLTGLSMGGYGTWRLGLSHPERFAAIAPICGGGNPQSVLQADPKRREQVRRLPVWAFHGAKDPTVRLEESQRMVNALKQIGNTTVELTTYPDAGHDSWTVSYDNPKLYEWFLSHSLQIRK